MNPYLSDKDFTLFQGDAYSTLQTLPDDSIDCVVTSPPYYGLRDYGTEGQIGLEPTLDAYIERLVGVFSQIKRVLKPTGTVWLNLGDSYVSSPAGNKEGVGATSGLHGANDPSGKYRETLKAGHQNKSKPQVRDNKAVHGSVMRPPNIGLAEKNLMGVPWRVAFALQDDGWYLRSDIIWHKPNPMPESITDRPTKSHEYVFMLTKSKTYFFDQEAVREPAEWNRWGDQSVGPGSNPNGWIKPKTREELNANRSSYPSGQTTGNTLGGHVKKAGGGVTVNPAGRNIRSVWSITTQPYAEAHFAVFPEALPERCIKAGCPEQVCGTCGKPRERIVERDENIHPGDSGRNDLQGAVQRGKREDGKAIGTVMRERHEAGREATTVGWSDCGHGNWQAGTVLDPFMGSGTTAVVARKLARRCIGIELSCDYCDLISRRTNQLSLLA